jgi:hypothetical protein
LSLISPLVNGLDAVQDGRLVELEPKVKGQMIKPKRSAERQVTDEVARKALNPLAWRQAISVSQAEPEFQENHKRLKADRLAREAGLKAKGKL